MKRLILLTLAFVMAAPFLYSQNYFYGDNGAQELSPRNDTHIVHFETIEDYNAFDRVSNSFTIIKSIAKYNMVIVETNENLESNPLVSSLDIKSIVPVYELDDGFDMWLGYELLFEPKPGMEQRVLQDLKDLDVDVRRDQYGSYIGTAQHPHHTLHISNQLVESGDVNWAHPNFYANHTKFSDPNYPNQFQMNNTGQTIQGYTGQADVDCDAPEAWDITTGSSSITVAVIDDGVQASHPDLENSSGASKVVDGHTPANNGNGDPIASNDGHGTACAGIIGASHNTIGVRGVAPGVNLLSVNIFQGSETTADLAAAFNWARTNGADVMSNSWGYTSCNLSLSALNNAINNARNNGRSGLGSVVIFASGNGYKTCVDYPADLSYVMAVGAVTNMGSKSNYSNEGPALDVVAPSNSAPGQAGAGVYTIDRTGSAGYSSGSYTSGFGGTSAACPVVSGVAALILSVDPSLEENEVRELIEDNATDMGATGFDNTFGHGRVSAYDALSTLSIPTNECTSSIGTLPYSENFENGFGAWTQDPLDDLDWISRTGTTPSSNTGPSGASEGNDYIYVEASSPNYPSKIARLVSPCFDLTSLSDPALMFDYHMYGTSMGSLSVEASADGVVWEEVWTMSGNQGSSWFPAVVDLSSYSNNTELRLRLVGTTGTGYTSDIAVDGLSLGEAVPETYCQQLIDEFPYSEGFESASFEWSQLVSDQLDWTRDASGTPSSSTGPATASEGNYYLYIEASSPNYPSKNAIIESSCFDFSNSSNMVISFDYHMYGSSMGSLELLAQTEGGNWVSLWSLSGNQGNAWKTTEVSLDQFDGETGVKFRFEGTTGNGFRSDMAIDDVSIFESSGSDCSGEEIDIVFNFDGNPSEISWIIYDDNNQIAAISSSYDSNLANSTFVESVCLETTCFTFSIFDSGNNGLCCANGNGSYQIIDSQDNILHDGGAFPNFEYQALCAGETSSNDCPTIDFNSTGVDSYGGTQDEGSFSIENGGAQLNIANNAWKSIPLNYVVTPNTVISFDFRSTSQGEIHGIGFDNNNSISTTYTFKVHGTQNWGITNYDNYVSGWTHYTIPVGSFYTGTFNRLCFVSDNDAGSGDNSSFRDVQVYETGDCVPQTNDIGTQNLVVQYGNEPEGAAVLQVFPNPSSSATRVSVDLDDAFDLVIRDLQGRVVHQTHSNSYFVDVNVQEFASGIYLIEVYQNQSLIDKSKLIVQH